MGGKASQFNINYPFPFKVGCINNRCTLLHIATYYDLNDMVNALLAVENIDVNAIDRDKVTPLHRAAGNGNADIVKALLVVKDIDVNAVDSIYGATPLHWAAGGGNAKIVKALFAKGAEINAVDQGGETPLHYAAENDRKRAVRALLKREANPLLKNNYGKIPRDLAKRSSIRHILDRSEKETPRELMIYACCVTVVLLAVLTAPVILNKDIAIEVIPSVLIFFVITALVVGVIRYKMLQRVPSTRVDEVQIEEGRNPERISIV